MENLELVQDTEHIYIGVVKYSEDMISDVYVSRNVDDVFVAMWDDHRWYAREFKEKIDSKIANSKKELMKILLKKGHYFMPLGESSATFELKEFNLGLN